MRYGGRKDLGEYLLLDLTHRIESNNKMASVNIKLKTLFGFHLLNSYTPSFLISVISYSTLFFPVTDFNERVMVSLTSLLVLAALFTQASETSVRTQYFKFLDIWYVFLIFFNFLIVIVNVLLHRIKENAKEKRNKWFRKKVDNGPDEYGDKSEEHLQKLILHYNFVGRISFAVFFCLFLLFYTLGASEVI